MFKQIVFSAVAVLLASQAHAIDAGKIEGKDAGKAKDQALKEQRIDEAKSTRTSKELVMANASKKLDEYLGSVLDSKDKQVILDLASKDKVVARALIELVKSKKADKQNKTDVNAMIDDAQTSALKVLAEIPDLQKRIAESDLDKGIDKLSHAERKVVNLIVQVPSKARKDWSKEDKATAAQAIKLLAEEAKGKSLEAAMKEVARRMNINEDALEKVCS